MLESYKELQLKREQLTEQLECSLSLQSLMPTLFDKGTFTLQAISCGSVYGRSEYVKIGTVNIIRVKAIYQDGGVVEIPLSFYALHKGGRLVTARLN